jgi:hypothetical protein
LELRKIRKGAQKERLQMNEIHETKSGKGKDDKQNNKLGLNERRNENKGRYMEEKKK